MSTHVSGEEELIFTFPWALPTTDLSLQWAAVPSVVYGSFYAAPLGGATFSFQDKSLS